MLRSLAPAPLPPADRYRRVSRELRRVNLALFVAGLTTFMALYSTQALLPVLSQAFHVSPTASSLLVSMATGTLALAVIPVSSLSERFGRTRVMLVSSAVAAPLGLLLPLCPSFPALVAVRTLQGIALAGVPAVAMAYLTEEVHPEALGGAVGLYIGGNAIGGMAGRLIAGGLCDLGGWRVAVGGVALMGAAARRRKPASPDRYPRCCAISSHDRRRPPIRPMHLSVLIDAS